MIADSVRTQSGLQLASTASDSGAGNRNANETGNADVVGTSGRAMGNRNAITDLSQLTGTSAAQMNGRHVRLENVKVDRVTGSRGFWTTDNAGHTVFVALDRNIRQPNLRQGETVTVAGRVAKTPSDQSRVDKAAWGLSDQDVNQLRQEPVFIHANAVMNK